MPVDLLCVFLENYSDPLPIFKSDLVFCCCWDVLSSLYIVNINPLLQVTFANIFSYSVVGRLFFFLDYLFIFRERGGEGEREGEKHLSGTHPDQGSNQRTFTLRDNVQPTEPHWSGCLFILIVVSFPVQKLVEFDVVPFVLFLVLFLVLLESNSQKCHWDQGPEG